MFIVVDDDDAGATVVVLALVVVAETVEVGATVVIDDDAKSELNSRKLSVKETPPTIIGGILASLQVRLACDATDIRVLLTYRPMRYPQHCISRERKKTPKTASQPREHAPIAADGDGVVVVVVVAEVVVGPFDEFVTTVVDAAVVAVEVVAVVVVAGIATEVVFGFRTQRATVVLLADVK